MTLLEGMKNEQLGLAILYNFIKEYGVTPHDTLKYVLPLIYQDDFCKAIEKDISFAECLKKAEQNNPEVRSLILENIESMANMTEMALAYGLIMGLMASNDGHYEILEGEVLEMNEVYYLADMLKELDESLESYLKKASLKLAFLDSDTIGEDIDLSQLNVYGEAKLYKNLTEEQVKEIVKDLDIVLVNKVRLNESNLAGSNVKMIAEVATGVNNIDIEYCKEHGIVVKNVAGYSTNAVAQHTMSMLLHLYEHNEYFNHYVQDGAYSRSGNFTCLDRSYFELEGKTWGIVGLGAIGSRVASLAEAFGCHVQYFSTSGKNHCSQYKEVDFQTLLESSDIISIHAPLNDDTRHLFNILSFKRMKKTAYIINVGRGEIISTKDLAKALVNKDIAGAGLDVFEGEPIAPDHPLMKIQDYENLIMTPHISWATVEARKRLMEGVYKNIEEFISSK